MWEKFRESKFAKKCKELSKKGGFLVVFVCIVLTLTIVMSVSIATNRAKKKYADTAQGSQTEQSADQTDENTESNGGVVDDEINAPIHNNTEAPTGADVQELELSLPASGVVSKGHDSTIQVWSATMEDYRVHLGIDILTEAGAPVFAAADGKIEKVWDDALMGRCVAISHDGEVFTFYKNLDANLAEGIEAGVTVSEGQQIGTVGETAIIELADEPHLHLEMTVNGLAVDPVDYLSEEAKEALRKDSSFEASVNGADEGK